MPTPAQHGGAGQAIEFEEHLERALDNPRLSENLTAFQQGWRSARDRAFGEIDFATLRSGMQNAKRSVTADLERYLEQFHAHAAQAGAHVHYAADAAETQPGSPSAGSKSRSGAPRAQVSKTSPHFGHSTVSRSAKS